MATLDHIVCVQSPSGLTWHGASFCSYIIVRVPYFSIHPILASTSFSNLPFSIYLICQSTLNASFFSSTLFSHLPYLSSTLFSNLTFLIYLIYKSTLNHHLPQNAIYLILSPTKYVSISTLQTPYFHSTVYRLTAEAILSHNKNS